MRDVSIIGMGQTKVGEHWEKSLRDLAVESLWAAMADAGVSTVSGAGAEVFGNTSHAASPPFTGTDCVVSGNYSVGDYIVNGANDIACSYSIAADGTVNQVWTP